MEVPKTHKVYNGAQRGAVASDIEVVPDTEDEASIPAQSSAQGSTTAVRHAMSDDMNFDFEDEVSGQPIQVNVVARSCDAVKGKDANEHALVSNDDACAREQWYDPMRKSETSDAMYQRRIHDSGMRGMGAQRRLFEDLRAELTEELRFQQ